MLVRLARLETPGMTRTRRWNVASHAWASIGRHDLIGTVKGIGGSGAAGEHGADVVHARPELAKQESRW
jgi:hypothetical protein